MTKLFFLFFMACLILNPYTVVGPLGYALVLPFFIYSLYRYGRFFDTCTLSIVLMMVLISLVGVASSILHDIAQFEHLKVSISLLIYVGVGSGLYFVLFRDSNRFNHVVYISLLAVTFNGVVVLLEVFFPMLRDLIEFILVPSGNVDWTEGFRYRGIASGGGASLSVLNTVAVVFALYLYGDKYIGISSAVIFISILIFSLLFIGRTGLILLPIVFLSFVFFNFRKYFFKVAVFVFAFAALIFLSFDYLEGFLVSQYGLGFYNYSLGFLLEGKSGIEDEGTVRMVQEFLTVMPTTFPEVLVGYGFYGGSNFDPWTDSGYSRMFLSVGYLFGVSFYLLFFALSFNAIRFKPFLFLTIILVLLISEAKEPLLFSQYASRILFVLLSFAILERRHLQRISMMSFRS